MKLPAMLPTALAALALFSAKPHAQETELFNCFDEGRFCSESMQDVAADSSCGRVFYTFHGRVSWGPLTNVGPITISVRTHLVNISAAFPIYVLVVRVPEPEVCTVARTGLVVLEARGSAQCGGVWESVGPLDIVPLGVPLGERYVVQAEFLATPPGHHRLRSVGISCIRVTSHPTSVDGTTWSQVKGLFR